jgi:hypothetical protein
VEGFPERVSAVSTSEAVKVPSRVASSHKIALEDFFAAFAQGNTGECTGRTKKLTFSAVESKSQYLTFIKL